ncbi:MAG TPA: rod shape-determining protein MreC [Jatrophihabitantaceae bacterium]|jgi:rod shape-determining protein MreC|nr:rod shape-determining protein MreC [Jatrophihabitantaceae bacterium]
MTFPRRPTRRHRLTKRQRIAAAVLVAVAACFMAIDLTGSGLRGAHGGVRGTLGALYRGTDGALGPARRFLQGVPHASANRDTIARLRQENAQLKARLDQQSADATTDAALTRLRLAAGTSRVLPARVIALGPGSGFDWTVTLDVGTKNGVHIGQTVTDGVGLVGRILHASATSCVVLLAADPGSGVGARDTRSGELAVATGRGTAGFSVSPLDPKASLQVGDSLATGPAGRSTYVAGLALGTITSVRTSADGTSVAQVRAAVSPTALDLVGVLLSDASGPHRTPVGPAAQGTR